MPAAAVELELECQRAGIAGDGERLRELLAGAGFLREPSASSPSV